MNKHIKLSVMAVTLLAFTSFDPLLHGGGKETHVKQSTTRVGGGTVTVQSTSLYAFELNGDDTDTSLKFPNLRAITDGALTVANSSVLTAIHAASLLGVEGEIYLNFNSVLQSADFSSLTSFGVYFIANHCEQLATVKCAALLPADETFISFYDCALDQKTVDLILHRGVESGATTCYIELSGGTSSPPSTVGLVDKALLIARGNSINTN
jgi:hypothetical protein